jgi:hypothetical protein
MKLLIMHFSLFPVVFPATFTLLSLSTQTPQHSALMYANSCPLLTTGGQASHPHRQQKPTDVLVHSVDWKWDDERFPDENVNETLERDGC